MTSVAIIHNHPIHYQHLLFCELAKRGLDFELLLVAAFSTNRLEAPVPEDSEYACSIGDAGSYEGARPAKTARFIWRSLNRIRPSIVIISGYCDAAAWTAWFWASLHGVKKILWSESNVFDHPRHVWRELPKRVFVKGCDCAHVYGTSSREYLERLGMPRTSIRTKRAVVDTALFLNAPETKTRRACDAIRLLYCGRLSQEKNLSSLIRALAGVRQNKDSPRLRLMLIGSGPLEEALRLQVENLGIASIVDFMGWRRQADLPQFFRDSDVLILPSASEQWGLVVNEAMLSGLPVAVSEQCGCAVDLVKPENGWVFSPYDEAGLTALLEKIADTPRQVLEEMGRVGRSLAAEYSVENCSKATMEMVNGILLVSGSHGLPVNAGS